ncbi:hypothetical protein ig2599ANME_0209 [groundwater metagenome]
MDVKKKIIITGQKVHDIGYRPFLLGIAESLGIESFFADNTFVNKKQAVYALVDSSEEKVEAFVEIASSKFPEKSDVEKVDVEGYSGNVSKIESYYRYLTAMQLSKIAAYGGKMLEKQDKMLEKQDTTIHILERIEDKHDRSVQLLETIKEDTSDMRSTLSRTESDIKDTKFSLSAFIEEKYQKLEVEIAEIKATLARMQAAG